MGKQPPVHHIGIDISAAVTQGGGIGRYTRELIQALTRPGKRDDGFRFHLFSSRRPDPLPVANPIPTGKHIQYRESRLDARWLYRLWYRLKLPLPVQQFTGPVDLFHSPDFVLPPVRGAIPTLLTVHDLSFIHYPQTFTPALIRFLNDVVPRSVKRATHILADSQATKDDLLSVWQVPERKVTVLYSGVHPRFRPENKISAIAAVRRKYGLDDAPYLLSLSTIQPRKNYPLLIRAFRAIANDWPHTLAIGGGKGWMYAETFAEVERQKLGGRVRFIDFVVDEDLPALYSGATLFLFPSLYEGFGLPPLEAMACGVPVLVSDASCLPEVVGEAGYLLSPHEEAAWQEAMHRLLLDTGRRATMVAAGFRQARQFTWKNAARHLREIYRDLLQT
jgi:glycosyltransferase involved in cell wall biosynthesis